MRRTLFLSLPLLMTAGNVPLWASDPAPVQTTRTVVSGDEPPVAVGDVASPGAVAMRSVPPVKLTYTDLKRTYHPDADATLASVRADAASNSGRVIELSGKVSGMMTTPRGRTVIFNQDENIAIFPMAVDLPGAELVSAGQNVRGLFLVTLEDADVVLKPLAFAAAAAPKRLPPSIAAAISGNVPITSAPVSQDDNGVIIAPQFGDSAIPAGAMAVMSAPQRVAGGRSIAPRASAPVPQMDGGDGLARTYDALARRFNPKLTAAQSAEIGAAIVSASRASSLDPRFLSSIIAVESDFDPYCLSSSGAMGLAQLMPFNLRGLGINNAWSPTQNITGAAKMLRYSLNEYSGRPDATLLAVAAYNAGSGAVRRAGYRVPNGNQVQRYVWKVYNQYKAFAPELFASR